MNKKYLITVTAIMTYYAKFRALENIFLHDRVKYVDLSVISSVYCNANRIRYVAHY